VVLVVLEIRHPTAGPLARSAQIQIKQALAKDFPLHRVTTLTTIQGTVGGSSDVSYEKAPKYMSRDQTLSVTFRSEAIVVETTRYVGYQWLRRLAGLVFKVRQEVDPVDGVERIGLRYVNEIRVPNVGSRLTEWHEWIDPTLLGPAPIVEDLGLDTGQMQCVFLLTNAADRAIILRYGLREGYAVDPGGDLKRPSPAPGPFFLLDIDSSWTPAGEIPEPDPDKLPELCDELHSPIRKLFETFITAKLRAEVLSNVGQVVPPKSIRGNAVRQGHRR
jgi:uncharacterized protein (TIGR04255 family)